MSKSTKSLILNMIGYILAALLFIIPISIVIAIMMWDAHESCDTFARINPDFDVMWVRGEGCMVKYNGMFIHIDDVVNVLSGR